MKRAALQIAEPPQRKLTGIDDTVKRRSGLMRVVHHMTLLVRFPDINKNQPAPKLSFAQNQSGLVFLREIFSNQPSGNFPGIGQHYVRLSAGMARYRLSEVGKTVAVGFTGFGHKVCDHHKQGLAFLNLLANAKRKKCGQKAGVKISGRGHQKVRTADRLKHVWVGFRFWRH